MSPNCVKLGVSLQPQLQTVFRERKPAISVTRRAEDDVLAGAVHRQVGNLREGLAAQIRAPHQGEFEAEQSSYVLSVIRLPPPAVRNENALSSPTFFASTVAVVES